MNLGEIAVRRAIEDRGYQVHDANIVLRANCPNIDLIVFGKSSPKYIQVKSSNKPAVRDRIVVSGAPFTHEQLFDGAPIYNKHDSYKAHLIAIVHQRDGLPEFYLAPPLELERMLRRFGKKFYKMPKRDGSQRSSAFRGELMPQQLAPYRDAWHLLD